MVTTTALTENSRQGINFQIPPCTGLEALLSPNPRLGCGHRYDETAVDLVVYVRNDPINLVDPDGRQAMGIPGPNTVVEVIGTLEGVIYVSSPAGFILARMILGWGVPWDPGTGTPGNGGAGSLPNSKKEANFLAAAKMAQANWKTYSSEIRKAVPEGSVFTPQMMDCMAGLESTWNPDSDGPGTRTGLFQYDKAGWQGDTDALYSIENVQDISLSVSTALSGLEWRYEASLQKRPDRTPEQHLARAFSLFNGEKKYGQYGYGQAIVECAKYIDTDFNRAYRSIWGLLNK